MLERLRSDLIDAVRALLATPVTTFATVLLLAVASAPTSRSSGSSTARS